MDFSLSHADRRSLFDHLHHFDLQKGKLNYLQLKETM